MTLFTTPYLAVFGLIAGFLFGFLLRKGGVTRFDTIVKQLLLQDFTVMKVILTAIVVGSAGIYTCSALGLVPTLHLSPTPLMWSLIGGGIFGIGMGLAGYCPGTGFAAIAEGSRDMITGFVGMLVGSALFNALSPAIHSLYTPDSAHMKTFATFFDIPTGVAILAVTAVWALFVVSLRKLRAT